MSDDEYKRLMAKLGVDTSGKLGADVDRIVDRSQESFIEWLERSEAAREAIRTTKADAKIAADQFLQNGVPASSKYKCGVPTTRQEFEVFYANLEKVGAPRDKALMDNYTQSDAYFFAKEDAALAKSLFLPVVTELYSRGENKAGDAFLEFATHELLKPADVDLKALPADLTDKERGYIRHRIEVAKLIGQEGLLQSTADNAPEPAKGWAGDVLEERRQAEEQVRNLLKGGRT